ncbi:stress responsive protein [Desulfuromonas versatilis]|uniref:Stress responsive protein n=1 Tax=Desulfuromonas versatilis TaxID=2802975 RepID=A0ABN6DU91_9BACT|nr:Dabb family protein [Desulfuromonas versatilis]BCR03625.1 stress responsive protein [Desulfuromonas versatilis]
MLKHLVFMKFKPETSDAQIAAIEEALGALPDAIPEIKEFVFGRDVVRSERSYDFGLVSSFDDLEAMGRYQVHPDHQAALVLIKAAVSGVVAVDFEY